jgi:ABC-2 type transport system permease protein
MGAALRGVAEFLPLTVVTNSIRDPWLGLGSGSGSLLAVAGLAAGAALLAARRSAL